MTTATPPQQQQIEMLMDVLGVNGMVDAMEGICLLKAAHVRENWQDETLAKAWELNARRLDSITLENL